MNIIGISMKLCIKISIIWLEGQPINRRSLSMFRKTKINGTKGLSRISTMTSMMVVYSHRKNIMKIVSQLKSNQRICGKLMREDKEITIMIEMISRPLSVEDVAEELTTEKRINNSKMTNINKINQDNKSKILKVTVVIEGVIDMKVEDMKAVEEEEISYKRKIDLVKLQSLAGEEGKKVEVMVAFKNNGETTVNKRRRNKFINIKS